MEDTTFNQVCKGLRHKRVKHAITLATLAEVTGMSASNLSRLERGVFPQGIDLIPDYQAGLEKLISGQVPYKQSKRRYYKPIRLHAHKDTPAQPQPQPNTHYSECTHEQTAFIAQALQNFTLSTHALATLLGLPDNLLEAKLKGQMPMYSAEFDAAIEAMKTLMRKGEQRQGEFPF